MGFLSKMIAHIIAKKTEDAVVAKLSEEMAVKEEQHDRKKSPINKSHRELGEFICAYFCLSLLLFLMMLIVCQIDDLSWRIILDAFAMSVFLSYLLFLVGIIIYRLYRTGFLPVLFLVVPLPLLVVLFLCIEYGFDILGKFFSGVWMENILKIILLALGILTIILSLAYFAYVDSHPQIQKGLAKKSPQNAEEKVKPGITQPTNAFSVSLKKLSLKQDFIINSIDNKKSYRTRTDLLAFLAPTIRLIDMSNKEIAYVYKSSALLSRQKEYKLFLDGNFYATIYQQKKDKSCLDLSELGIQIAGDFKSWNFCVNNKSRRTIIRFKESTNRNEVCSLEYVAKEHELLSLLILMTAKLAETE